MSVSNVLPCCDLEAFCLGWLAEAIYTGQKHDP